MKQETIDLYSIEQHIETDAGINAMATRFHVRNKDVLYAMWTIAKDLVWAKLTQDRKALEEEIAREEAAMLKTEAANE